MRSTTLDLYRRGFNPVLETADEPDWKNPDKHYSEQVQQLFGELQDKDTLVVVFPVWWYSFPAMIKGWIDRVLNYGLAYGGGRKIPVSRIRWVALVGGSGDKFAANGWEENLSHYLNTMVRYIGVEDSAVTFLYNTIGVEEGIDNRQQHYDALFSQARGMVKGLR
ncbi:Glutathione-regulated potassium-efflux system ancillary protein kefF [Shimwellia blattae]|nr:Glutathione-regulated potassium-efflux system ancillary protein kefF [Shimwellia blattae]